MKAASRKGEALERLIPRRVRRLHGYVPGEQPKLEGMIKLNTNENPYPPSPKVLRAVKNAVDDRLRLYPNPTAAPLRTRLARLHCCRPEQVLIGNGSDELLALAVRAFVEPSRARLDANAGVVQFFAPSYSLYPVLAAIHGASINAVQLEADFKLPSLATLRSDRKWNWRAALSFLTTPNAPAGRGYSTKALRALCRQHKGIIILDEAYVDFANENALSLALEFPHVLVARTFSKAYSLCFQRVGYLIGHPMLIEAMDRIRDSYNVNGLGQIAATATLDALPYYRRNFDRIRATRERLRQELGALGFVCLPSQANFILAAPPARPAQEWLQRLRDERILVRWFDQPRIRQYLRITVGTDVQADALIAAVRGIQKPAN